MQEDLNQLLKILLANELDFLVVGGFAAVVHGSSHVTKDLDITMMMTPENVEKLREALKDLNPQHRMNPGQKLSFLEEPKDTSKLNNIYLETNAGVLDVVSLEEGLGTFGELKERAIQVELFGYPCNVLSLDDLIRVKEKMKRPKDLIVLDELKAIKKKNN